MFYQIILGKEEYAIERMYKNNITIVINRILKINTMIILVNIRGLYKNNILFFLSASLHNLCGSRVHRQLFEFYRLAKA